MVQSMADASPTKWHLAHTTWFFETFVLRPHAPGYRVFDDSFAFLFNSYYDAVGERVERGRRGLLARPSLERVQAYREHVDQAMGRLLDDAPGEVEALVVLGVNHEQQHQELILTDIKHAFATHPLRPAYAPAAAPDGQAPPPSFRAFDEGLVEIGHHGDGFAFDNEGPRHRRFLRAFALCDRLVTCGEYLAFMRDGGYRRPELWLSDGWQLGQREGWQAPLYWEARDGGWAVYTLGGVRPVNEDEALCHVSYFEADAFARWAGARLPTEEEWEHAAAGAPVAGNLAEAGRLQPDVARPGTYGDAWVWTASAYAAYPGYRPPPGALGEYNGKFMCSQMVLRGGSCFTPADHLRATYRNFFPPGARWQVTGIRLAQDR